MERRSIQILEPWSASVLYSLTTLNGEEYDTDGVPEGGWPDGLKTEFWVKGFGFDVKVHELDSTTAGWKCVGGVCSYSETEGVYATQEECESSRSPRYQHEKSITGGCEPWVVYQLTIEITATVRAQSSNGVWSEFNYQGTLTERRQGGPIRVNGALGSNFNSPFLEFWSPPNSFRLLRPVVYSGIGTSFPRLTYLQTGVDTGLGGGWFNVHISESSVSVTAVREDGGPDPCGELEIPPENKGNIIGYNCGGAGDVDPLFPPYESFVSTSKNSSFALVKSGKEDGDDSSDFAELAYKKINIADGAITDLGETGDADDWRKDAVNLAPTASIEIEDSNPCLRDFLTATNATLNDGNLYTLDLNQSVGADEDAPTLKTLLESDPGEAGPTHLTVDTMIVHARPDNDNPDVCRIGTGTPLPCRIPIPGRGNVLGVAIMPN